MVVKYSLILVSPSFPCLEFCQKKVFFNVDNFELKTSLSFAALSKLSCDFLTAEISYFLDLNL